MKKILIPIFLLLVITNLTSFGQTIDLSKDSIAMLLCKKWTTDYAMMKGVKIEKTPDAPDINFEFKKDNTFSTTMSGVKEKHTGTWGYDSKNKLIQLIANGKKAWRIISLKENELTMLADMKPGMPEEQIRIVYKVLAD